MQFMSQIKKELDLVYLDVKRSIVTRSTQIPTWIYLLLIVLGWNEFLAILKSPLYLALLLILLSVFTVTHVLGIQRMLITQVFSFVRDVRSTFPSILNSNYEPKQDDGVKAHEE